MLARTAVAIALGSNLGDRAAHLDFAVSRLRELLAGVRVSSYHPTAPVDVPDDQPDFLNAAVTGRTMLGAAALLDRLLAIEGERGRERPHRHAARTLDLDLLLYGDAIIDQPGLTVPHPHFRDRAFVLAPLAEIAGDWRDPVTGKSVAELAIGLSTSTR